MAGTMSINIRAMQPEDYDKVYQLWLSIEGFGIRSIDDSREGMERFLKRNPELSVVAEQNGQIVGSIMVGHDGRTGCFYHVCVSKKYRQHGVGYKMVRYAVKALQSEGINNVTLIAFKKNQVGNEFWKRLGWNEREEVNYYSMLLNEENITRFNE